MQTDSTASADSPILQTLSREAYWQQHVTQWQQSGLSKTAYCQQYSLVYHQMVYWCSKVVAKDNVDTGQNSCDFVPVSVSTLRSGASGLSVRLPNGIAIEGIDEHSVPLVRKLVDLL